MLKKKYFNILTILPIFAITTLGFSTFIIGGTVDTTKLSISTGNVIDLNDAIKNQTISSITITENGFVNEGQVTNQYGNFDYVSISKSKTTIQGNFYINLEYLANTFNLTSVSNLSLELFIYDTSNNNLINENTTTSVIVTQDGGSLSLNTQPSFTNNSGTLITNISQINSTQILYIFNININIDSTNYDTIYNYFQTNQTTNAISYEVRSINVQ